MLLHQDLGNYKELSLEVEEETIRRRRISFSLSNMGFTDMSDNPVASGMPLSPDREYHYRSNCYSFKAPGVWYNKNPKNLVDDMEDRNKLASDVAREYILVKYSGIRIIDLKIKDTTFRFSGGKQFGRHFSLDLTADVSLEEKVF